MGSLLTAPLHPASISHSHTHRGQVIYRNQQSLHSNWNLGWPFFLKPHPRNCPRSPSLFTDMLQPRSPTPSILPEFLPELRRGGPHSSDLCPGCGPLGSPRPPKDRPPPALCAASSRPRAPPYVFSKVWGTAAPSWPGVAQGRKRTACGGAPLPTRGAFVLFSGARRWGRHRAPALLDGSAPGQRELVPAPNLHPCCGPSPGSVLPAGPRPQRASLAHPRAFSATLAGRLGGGGAQGPRGLRGWRAGREKGQLADSRGTGRAAAWRRDS